METRSTPISDTWGSYREALVRLLGLFPYQDMLLDVVRHADIKPYDRVLELGCGPGAAGPWVLQQFGAPCHYTGLDSDPRTVDRARIEARKYRRGLLSVRLLEADLNLSADTWVLGSAHFDVGFSTNAWYTLADPVVTLAEVAKVVRRRLIISTPGPNPNMMAVLREHLSKYSLEDGPEADGQREQEAQRMQAFLADAAEPNNRLIADPNHHFPTKDELYSWYNPHDWFPVHYSTHYGDNNHLFVLDRLPT